MHKLFFTVVLSSALLAFSATATAKSLYVDSSRGSDSVSYSENSSNSPWATIGRAAWGSTNRSAPNAAEAARAGDTVSIASGTYTTAGVGTASGGSGRWEVAYNPVNEGTATNPIRFQGTGTVNLTFSSGAGPMIGANNRNYIQWSGFSINESTAPSVSDTGPVAFFGADFDYLQGGSIENSVLVGNPNWTTREGDNYNGVRLEYVNGVRISNNIIRNFGGDTDAGGGGTDHNHSGITTYKWENLTVENNTIENCGSGIYLKATQTATREVGTNVIRFNIFSGNEWGVHVHRAPNTASEPILIYQNIFRNNVSGVRILKFGDATDPKHVKVLNNTFDSQTSAALEIGTFGDISADSGYVWWNNIVVGTGHGIIIQHPLSNVVPTKIDAEHNVYGGSVITAEVAANDLSFSAWQNLGQDTDDGGVADGLSNASVQFANSSAGDYHLLTSSPARGLGRVHPSYSIGGSSGAAIPAGAYISGSETIGPNSQVASTIPNAPQGLTIVD